jgi:hypothetical protein
VSPLCSGEVADCLRASTGLSRGLPPTVDSLASISSAAMTRARKDRNLRRSATQVHQMITAAMATAAAKLEASLS